jgi:hypothetical protein
MRPASRGAGSRATTGGNREVVEGDAAKVSVHVVSACLDALDGMGE